MAKIIENLWNKSPKWCKNVYASAVIADTHPCKIGKNKSDSIFDLFVLL